MRSMTRPLVAVAVLAVTSISGGSDSAVSEGPCESPSTREAWQTCRPPTAAEVRAAELLIASVDPPISADQVAMVIASTQPGLAAEVGYFVVPLDGPQPAGAMSLTSGVDEFVSLVAAALARNGQVGADRVVIHAIGFLPAGSDDSISNSLQTLIDVGFDLYLCTIPPELGGCSVPPP